MIKPIQYDSELTAGLAIEVANEKLNELIDHQNKLERAIRRLILENKLIKITLREAQQLETR